MTVIDLAIRADDEALRADLEESPVEAPAAAVEQTYFLVPMRLAVDGKELLAFPGAYEAWRPLPLLGFAPHLRDVATGLREGEAATLSLTDGGCLEFRRRGAEMVIRSSLTGDEATVSAERLAEAAVGLAAEACAYVLSIVPAMAAHGSWESWCSGTTRIASEDR